MSGKSGAAEFARALSEHVNRMAPDATSQERYIDAALIADPVTATQKLDLSRAAAAEAVASLERRAINKGAAVGRAQVAMGWIADMVGGAATIAETS